MINLRGCVARKALLALAFLTVPGMGVCGFHTGFDLNRWAQADERVGERRGSEADAVDSGTFYGYVIGTTDALVGHLFCLPENTRAGQVLAIVKKYLREHPERWGEPARNLVISALAGPFPCSGKK